MISSATSIPELYWATFALVALIVLAALAVVGLVESLRPTCVVDRPSIDRP